jgi:hypothetical protein
VTSVRDAQPECPTCRQHLTAVLAGEGHISPAQWSAFLEHRASPHCRSGKQVRRRTPRRALRKPAYS